MLHASLSVMLSAQTTGARVGQGDKATTQEGHNPTQPTTRGRIGKGVAPGVSGKLLPSVLCYVPDYLTSE